MGKKSKTERTRETQLDFKLSLGIKDFGPINSGKIDLKPLTIFIGPNNSGKSYAAVLINLIQNVHRFLIPSFFPVRAMPSRIYLHYPQSISPEFHSDVIELDFLKLADISKANSESDLRNKFQKFFQSYIDNFYIKLLQQRMSSSFSATLDDLKRKGTEKATLDIETSKFKVNLELFENKIHRQSDNISTLLEPYNDIFIELFKFKGKKHYEERIIEKFFEILNQVFYNAIKPSFYLPAARSGILQAHNVIVSSLIRDAAYVGTRKFEIPKLSEVIAIFLESLVNMVDKKGEFFNIACELEKELLNGEIAISRSGEFKHPEIKYKASGMEISMQRASSSVSELAPIILYMKHYLRPGSILIIEEPEAHLHPKNQYILAKYLVRLVREKVYVVITTHSDILLEQINNSLFRNELKGNNKQVGNDKNIYIKKDEIAAYLFKPCKKKDSGFNIEPISITDEEGISDEEFSNIMKYIYDESVLIRKRLQSIK